MCYRHYQFQKSPREGFYKYLKVTQHCAYTTTQEQPQKCNSGIDTYLLSLLLSLLEELS